MIRPQHRVHQTAHDAGQRAWLDVEKSHRVMG